MSQQTSPKKEQATSSQPAAESPQRPGKSTPSSINEIDEFLSSVKDATDDQKKLLTELYLANGQDAFDAEAAAVGRLKQEEYLAIPEGYEVPRVDPKDVGKAHIRRLFSAQRLAEIYLLNKERAPVGENAVNYAMIRMEAVKMGWVAGQKEIIYVPFTRQKDALTELTTDFAAVRNQIMDFRTAAFLIPLACEHTFRTMGHHYITGLAAEYQMRYKKTLKACLSEHLLTLLQPATMFHHVLHWVSPERAYNVLQAQLNTRTLPDALILRATAAPAGSAIITTTAAVLQAMASANLLDEIKEEFDGNLDDITKMADAIKSDVRAWHKAYFAYNVSPPSAPALKKMESVRDVAIAFAPYAQGFIEGTLKDAALGQAKALTKHAELNPVARTRAARFFRAIGRTRVENVEDLFKTDLKDATKTEDE